MNRHGRRRTSGATHPHPPARHQGAQPTRDPHGRTRHRTPQSPHCPEHLGQQPPESNTSTGQERGPHRKDRSEPETDLASRQRDNHTRHKNSLRKKRSPRMQDDEHVCATQIQDNPGNHQKKNKPYRRPNKHQKRRNRCQGSISARRYTRNHCPAVNQKDPLDEP